MLFVMPIVLALVFLAKYVINSYPLDFNLSLRQNVVLKSESCKIVSRGVIRNKSNICNGAFFAKIVNAYTIAANLFARKH